MEGDRLEGYRKRAETEGVEDAGAWYRGQPFTMRAVRLRAELRGAGRRVRERADGRTMMNGRQIASGWTADVRQELRSLWRRPGFTVAIIGTLALGIGATTLMFGLIDRLFLSPPQHIVAVDQVRHLYLERETRSGRGRVTSRSLTYPAYRRLHEVADFQRLAAYDKGPSPWPVQVGDDVGQALVVRASASLFPLLGVVPVAGRFFAESDDTPSAPGVVVLSEEFWVRQFGRDPSAIGPTIRISDEDYEIVGVAPAGFTGAEPERVELWIPLAPNIGRSVDHWNDWVIEVVVRLREDSNPEGAGARATAVYRSVTAALAEQGEIEWADPEARILASSLLAARGPTPPPAARVTTWLAALAVIVLLVACTNVTNLLLADNIRFQKDLAVRASVGASPVRVAGQLLAKTALLAGSGGVAGVALWFGLSPLLAGAFLTVAGFSPSEQLPRVLTFAGLTVLATTLGAGLVPSLWTTRSNALSILRRDSMGNTAAAPRLRRALVGGQAALSVLLLVGAALSVLSLRRAKNMDMGFSPTGVAEVGLRFRSGTGGDRTVARQRQGEIYRQVADRLQDLEGVASVATFSGTRPLYSGMTRELRVPGLDSVLAMPGGWPQYFRGSSKMLETYGFRVSKGRGPEREDGLPGAQPVMLISARTEDLLWPDGGAVGQCAQVVLDSSSGEARPCRRIIGVFDDVVVEGLDEEPAFAFFLPTEVAAPWGIAVRADRLDAGMIQRIRATALHAAPEVYFADVRASSERVDQWLGRWKISAWLSSALGLLGLVMACGGLNGILAFDVAQQRRKLGVMMALGAGSPRLVSTVLRKNLPYVLVGLAVGLAVAMVVGPLLEGQWFRTDPLDPGVYIAVIVALFASALAAALVPSLRAANSDPMEALRAE